MYKLYRQLSVKFLTRVEIGGLVYSSVGAIRESPLRLLSTKLILRLFNRI